MKFILLKHCDPMFCERVSKLNTFFLSEYVLFINTIRVDETTPQPNIQLTNIKDIKYEYDIVELLLCESLTQSQYIDKILNILIPYLYDLEVNN